MQADIYRFRAGEKIAVAASGGADSTALLRWLAAAAPQHGWTILAAHFQHNLRGQESADDEVFVRDLAGTLQIEFLRGNAPPEIMQPGRSFEEPARTARYAWFRKLMRDRACDTVVTAHTQTDQAETVLMKMLRGAWTEGLAGIAPEIRLEPGPGRIVRPLLNVRRADIENYLRSIGQPWRDDSSNSDTAMLRNDMRAGIMPLLRARNPGLDTHLSQIAALARDEESHWNTEAARVLSTVLLPGRAVRGGGRAVSTTAATESLALDAARLLTESIAMQRRVLRAAAARLNCRMSFDDTARLLDLLGGKHGRKTQLGHGVKAERTPRELHLERGTARTTALPAEVVCKPGTTEAPAFGVRVTLTGPAPATLRVWKAGDRVRLRYTLSEQKVKEALQRMQVPPDDRAVWPVLEREGKIIWLKDAETAEAGGATVETLT